MTDGAVHTFKAGSTVPVELTLSDGRGDVGNRDLTVTVVGGNQTVVAPTDLTYDSDCDCYRLNLKTKPGFKAGTTYTLIVFDGETRVAAVTLKAK